MTIALGLMAGLIGYLLGERSGFSAGVGFMMNMLNGIEITHEDDEQEGSAK